MPVCSKCGTAYGSTVRICVRDGTPLVSAPTDNQYLGTLLDGKYRIDSFVSAGGMGSVYRALHVMLDKTVAVKVIKNELVTSDEVVARFQREARAASNLNHPNIVSIYDLGQTDDGTLYIAMEFIDGPSLKEVIRRDGPLAPRQCIDILQQVASALSSAHRKQIVHRDLKSDNLMLVAEGERPIVKLVDFGIAKTFDDSTQLTAAGYMLGTPHYMSPEQAAGKPVDHRADLYSLGVILYEMLAGQVPFGDTALTSMLVKLATEVPPPPSARRPDGHVPPALDAVAMRCLEKDPDRRFQSAEEFADALEHASTEIDSVPPIPTAAIPVMERTLVRPANTRQATIPPAASAPQHVSVADVTQPVPASRPRAGLSGTHIVVILFVFVGIAAAIVGGMRFMNARQEGGPTATIQPPVSPSAPEPAPTPPAAQVPASPVSAQTPASPAPNISSNAASAGPPPSIDDGRARIPAARSSVSRSQGPSASPAPAVQSTSPRSSSTPDRTPPSTGPVTTPAPPPASTGPPPPPARIAPTVSVMCQGSPDVCGVIHAEIVRALQDQVTADVEIAVKVAQVSERPSSQFGTPSTVRTYSVDLSGSSRGAVIAMPMPRVFGFDALFGRATLQENARQIASATLEAVRTSLTKGN
jgi:serine/threonine protein kinase